MLSVIQDGGTCGMDVNTGAWASYAATTTSKNLLHSLTNGIWSVRYLLVIPNKPRDDTQPQAG